MFLKVLYARAFTRGRACEGKGKRKGRRKEKEKVRACSAHQGRTSAAKSYRMRDRSNAYAPEARGAKRKESRERRRCDTGATCLTVKRRGHKRAPQHAHQGTIGRR